MDRHQWDHEGQRLAADADGTIRRAFPNPDGPTNWWDDVADANEEDAALYGARFGLEAAAREILRLAEEVERLKDAAITQPPCPTCGAEQPDRACVRCGRDLRALDPLRHAAWHGAQQASARIRRELLEEMSRLDIEADQLATLSPEDDRWYSQKELLAALDRIVPGEV